METKENRGNLIEWRKKCPQKQLYGGICGEAWALPALGMIESVDFLKQEETKGSAEPLLGRELGSVKREGMLSLIMVA